MTREEANNQIAVEVAAAEAALARAEALATVFELTFHFSPAYGMGGMFDGSKDATDYHGNNDPGPQWLPSSVGC